MIKALRYKFIRITMSAVFSVLLLIILAVNAVNIYRNNASLDSVTQIILDNGGSFHKNQITLDKIKPELTGDTAVLSDRFRNKKELPFSTRFFTVSTDTDGAVTEFDLSSIASVTEDDIPDFAEKILAKKKTVGWLTSFRYRVGKTDNGYLLIIMEASSVKSSVLWVLAITVLVGIIAFLAVFVLVALFSMRAIKPISETYEKQKQFITDAGHELKTPLTVISANAEILSLTYGENEWCDGIERQAASMRDLISQMIQMSKLDEEGQKIVFERFNISEAVYDTAMSFAALAEKKGLHFSTDITPELYINGDEGSIRQAVAILTDNAVKYCDLDGEISVSALPVKELGKEHISVSVKNSYSAVDSLDTEKIFERFYRGDKSRAANHSYGLGLSIARAVIQKHGGRLCAVKGVNSLEMKITL